MLLRERLMHAGWAMLDNVNNDIGIQQIFEYLLLLKNYRGRFAPGLHARS